MLGRCPHGRGAPLEGQQPRRVPGGRCGRAPEGGAASRQGGKQTRSGDTGRRELSPNSTGGGGSGAGTAPQPGGGVRPGLPLPPACPHPRSAQALRACPRLISRGRGAAFRAAGSGRRRLRLHVTGAERSGAGPGPPGAGSAGAAPQRPGAGAPSAAPPSPQHPLQPPPPSSPGGPGPLHPPAVGARQQKARTGAAVPAGAYSSLISTFFFFFFFFLLFFFIPSIIYSSSPLVAFGEGAASSPLGFIVTSTPPTPPPTPRHN